MATRRCSCRALLSLSSYLYLRMLMLDRGTRTQTASRLLLPCLALCPRTSIYVSSSCSISSVLMLLYMCPICVGVLGEGAPGGRRAMPCNARGRSCSLTCFTSTNVQILTRAELQPLEEGALMWPMSRLLARACLRKRSTLTEEA
jgi:hypothetical protein